LEVLDEGLDAIIQGSSTQIPLRADSVSLTVTSPPYHNAINYEKHIERVWYRGNEKIPLDLYLTQMSSIFSQILGVTIEGGFCCIVIGNELDNGTIIPLPHLLTEVLCSAGSGEWNFHEEIIWNKVTGGLDRFGVTIQRPYPTYYRANVMHEHIIVLRKGKLKHTKDPASKFEINEIMKKDISNSLWNVAPVPPRYIDHPCPFPEEIPLRLITLYSNKNDLILDPFSGSGQTGKAAKFLGRKFVGIDLLRSYCKLANKRIRSEKIHVRRQLLAKWEKIGAPYS
jgi:DNA modification methylase